VAVPGAAASISAVALVTWLTAPAVEERTIESFLARAAIAGEPTLSVEDRAMLAGLGLDAAVIDEGELVAALAALPPVGAINRTTSPSVPRWSVLAAAAGERAGELNWPDGRVMELARGTPTLLARAWPERALDADGVVTERLRVELVSQQRGWRFGRLGERTDGALAAGRVFWETAWSCTIQPGRALVLFGRDESSRRDGASAGPPTPEEIAALERGDALRAGARYADLYMSGPLRSDGAGGFLASRRVVVITAQARSGVR
jgi:hypothetical protein